MTALLLPGIFTTTAAAATTAAAVVTTVVAEIVDIIAIVAIGANAASVQDAVYLLSRCLR